MGANDLGFHTCGFIRVTRVGQTTYEGRAVTLATSPHRANRSRCHHRDRDGEPSSRSATDVTINHGIMKKGKLL